MNQADKELNTLVLNKELGGRKKLALGLYVHVPFCSTTCDFCAFYQEKPSKKGMDAYFAGLRDEISNFPPDRPLSTVFFGGGTPGLLNPTNSTNFVAWLILWNWKAVPNGRSSWPPPRSRPKNFRFCGGMGLTASPWGYKPLIPGLWK
ncbi:MAG: hypothetical protein EBY43_07955, partial [Opitutae bacterium]|nr:hypothetical protein [Opitutae bacterium]